MALPPTVPSSFVPYSGTNARRYRADFGGAFGFLAYGVFLLIVAAAVGVFIYGRILISEKSADDSALAKTEAQLDQNTISDFLRLQNRLRLGASLLDSHVALSNVFTQLNTVMPSDVQFKSLSLTSNKGGYDLQTTGTAASLNALAQFSNDLGGTKKFKNAIVSGIKVNQRDNSVSFALTTLVDPSLTDFSASTAQSAPTQTESLTQPTATTTGSVTATTTP